MLSAVREEGVRSDCGSLALLGCREDAVSPRLCNLGLLDYLLALSRWVFFLGYSADIGY